MIVSTSFLWQISCNPYPYVAWIKVNIHNNPHDEHKVFLLKLPDIGMVSPNMVDKVVCDTITSRSEVESGKFAVTGTRIFDNYYDGPINILISAIYGAVQAGLLLKTAEVPQYAVVEPSDPASTETTNPVHLPINLKFDVGTIYNNHTETPISCPTTK
jgi:hypothetical protein